MQQLFIQFINYAFVGFSRIFLQGILIFKGLTARSLFKSFGVKGLKKYFKPALILKSYTAQTVHYKGQQVNVA
jgi:hypothetical protein